MFSASTPSGQESRSHGTWDTISSATGGYVSEERVTLAGSAAWMCAESVAGLAEISAATALEAPPVSAFFAVETAMGFAGCMAFTTTALVAPQDALQAASELTAVADPTALTVGVTGGLLAGNEGMEKGFALGEFLSDAAHAIEGWSNMLLGGETSAWQSIETMVNSGNALGDWQELQTSIGPSSLQGNEEGAPSDDGHSPGENDEGPGIGQTDMPGQGDGGSTEAPGGSGEPGSSSSDGPDGDSGGGYDDDRRDWEMP